MDFFLWFDQLSLLAKDFTVIAALLFWFIIVGLFVSSCEPTSLNTSDSVSQKPHEQKHDKRLIWLLNVIGIGVLSTILCGIIALPTYFYTSILKWDSIGAPFAGVFTGIVLVCLVVEAMCVYRDKKQMRKIGKKTGKPSGHGRRKW